MKKISAFFILCLSLFACSKTNSTPESQKTTYTAQIKIGNMVYNASNYSVQSGSVDDYQFDGMNIYGHGSACSAYGMEVQVIDTANGRLEGLALLNFLIPSVNNFTNYNSPLVQILIKDTLYTGHGLVSGDFTSNGGHNKVGGDSTTNGNFQLSGWVNNGVSTDSVAFTASLSCTNMPY